MSAVAALFYPTQPVAAAIRAPPRSSPSPLTVLSSSSFSSVSPFPHHGPSLRRGRLLGPSSEDPFARVFHVPALLVPAANCSLLEQRLRGHLLNWPRIRNVARVPGDDLDPSLALLLRDRRREGDSGAENRLAALAREERVPEEVPALSPVEYRQRLVEEFNCRGFLKFKNLARMSRPKKRKAISPRGGEIPLPTPPTTVERANELYLLEVLEEGKTDGLGKLVGDEGFGCRRWRGATRLLLLDERHAGKLVEELPDAVKVILLGDQSKDYFFELVQCRLTIYYKYWSMNEILEASLPDEMIVPTSFETVGHIAHLNLRDEHLPYKNIIAKVVLDKNQPRIQTVVNKIDAIQNDFRTMQLEVLAGNRSLVTTVIESGTRFQVDLATVYWNSRLGTERQRLVSIFSNSDVVCDVFSGVGPIAIAAAKKVKHVYANDLNPNAVEYLERNIVLNRLERKVEVYNMDGRRFISAVFSNQNAPSVSQVVMNLPNGAAEFLDVFRGIFWRRPLGSLKLPRIHVYGFSKATNPEYDFIERINMALSETVRDVEMHRVRLVAPGKWMLCASFVLPERAATAKPLVQG